MRRFPDYRWSDLPKLLALAACYALLMRLALGSLDYPGIVETVWVPAGIGVAAVVMGGAKVLPGIMLGAFFGYLSLSLPWELAAELALFSNTLEVLIAYQLLTRPAWANVRFNPHLENASDYLWLGLAGGVSACVGAIAGVILLYWAGVISTQMLSGIGIHWWKSSFLGCVLVTPMLLVWRHVPLERFSRARVLEAFCCFGCAFLVGQIVFLGWFSSLLGGIARDYWMFLFLVWAAVRFGRHGVTVMITMTAMQGLIGPMEVIRMFGAEAELAGLSNFWFFNITYSVVGTALALVISELRQAEDLRKSEERWKFALEGSGDGVWDWNIAEDIITFSSRYKDMLGFAEDDLPTDSTSWLQRIHPDDRARAVVDLQAYLDGRKPSFINEHREYCKDGSLRWMLSRGMVVGRDANGKPLRMIGTNSDITERKRAEQLLRRNEERFRRMLETSPIAVYIYRASDNSVVFANQGYINMLRTTQEKVLGATPATCYQNPREHDEINALLDQGETINNRELALRTVDGQDLWVLASFAPVEYEGEPAVLGWLYDVTGLRRAKELAEETATVKANFLASMSHEIRTPMNAIVGLSQLALNKEVSDSVRDYLEKINFSSQSLLGILNDILDFSKLDAGRVKIESSNFNLNTVLRNLHRLFSLNAEEKFLDFEIQVDENVPRDLVGDALRLQQILSNLLGNAIKFTERGKVSLHVSLVGVVDTQTTLMFRVEDTGIGMSDKEQSALFVPFSQADSSITRRFGGTGLGLAISNNLLHLMGSHFEVESTPGKGTVFGFQLTLGTVGFNVTHVMAPNRDRRKNKREAGILAADLSARGSPLHGARILLAEDNLINQQVATDFLELSGMTVQVANNGREALELLELEPFDAVLMDVNMPVMGGVEATLLIREKAEFDQLPVIALTAGVTAEERQHCLDNGMNDFVAKPIDPEKLIEVLNKWIKRQGEVPVSAVAQPHRENPFDLQLLPGFELANLLKMLRGNQQRILFLLRNFREEFASGLEKIEAALAEPDLHKAERLVHTLKGAAGSMGAKVLHGAAEKLDEELKHGAYTSETMQKFRQAFIDTMETLAALPVADGSK